MDFSAALDVVQNCNELPNRAAVIAAITAKIEEDKGLKDERDRLVQNNADLLKQKGAKVKEVERLQKEFADLIKTVGVEGESTEQQLAKFKELADLKGTLEQKIATLETEKKTEVEARSQAEKRASEIQRSLNNQQAAIKLNADADALNRLITLPLSIEGDQVFVTAEDGTKTDLKEYAKAQGKWCDRALFPTVATPDPAPADPAAPPTNVATKPGPTAPPAKPPEAKPLAASYAATAGYTGPAKK